MSDTDEDLREAVNNALAEEDSEARAEHDQDDITDDESPDGKKDVEDDSDTEDESTEEDTDEDYDSSDEKSDSSAPADEEDSEDDDDPAIDFAKPDFTPGSAQEQLKEFDIRTLPKDPETGLIDPIEANRLINEFYANQGKQSVEAQQREQKTKDLLTQQWARVSKKYPAVYGKPKLREMARDMHLNSIGTDSYLTPAQAAAKVERIRRDLVKDGYRSAKTRRTVEKMTRTERGSDRSNSNSGVTDYEKARRLANSSNPEKASLGRRQMLILRHKARQS